MIAFPSLDRFVEALPHGLDSYPDALAKAAILRHALSDVRLPEPDALPPALARLITDRPALTAWVPEVHFNAMMLAIYDCEFAANGGLARYERWAHERNRKLLRSPLYRILFLVVSPDRLLRGAEKRWSAFRRGTTLHVVEHTDTSAKLTFHYPPKLQTELSMLGLAIALRAALETAGAKHVVVTAGQLGDEQTDVHLRWG